MYFITFCCVHICAMFSLIADSVCMCIYVLQGYGYHSIM